MKPTIKSLPAVISIYRLNGLGEIAETKMWKNSRKIKMFKTEFGTLIKAEPLSGYHGNWDLYGYLKREEAIEEARAHLVDEALKNLDLANELK